MFWVRFFNLCESNGKRPLNVVKEIGIATGSITRWKNGSIPSGPSLEKIANYFGVSVDYLLGKEEKEKPAELGELSEGEKALLDLFNRVPADQQELVLRMIEAALSKL